jgi:hypothetical protein
MVVFLRVFRWIRLISLVPALTLMLELLTLSPTVNSSCTSIESLMGFTIFVNPTTEHAVFLRLIISNGAGL